MLRSIENRLILFALLSAIIYVAMSIYSETEDIYSSLLQFNFSSFIPTLFFIVLSMVAKYFRWKYYLDKTKIKMPLKEEIVIFLAGFIMAFSPGKLGEFIKSTLMKKKYNLNYSETLPVIICERITELLSLILILLFGLIYFEFDIIYIMIAILCTVIPIVLISRTVLFNKLIQKLSKYSYFNARISNLEYFKDSLRLLLGRKIMLISTFLSLVAWIFEFLGFYVIILGFEDTISFLLTCFIYSSSMIVGAVSMLPGGIGTTEAALTFLLIENGLNQSYSVAATILIRILTLWFSVLVGFFALIYYIRKNRLNLEN